MLYFTYYSMICKFDIYVSSYEYVFGKSTFPRQRRRMNNDGALDMNLFYVIMSYDIKSKLSI